jgi:hypothetical protein
MGGRTFTLPSGKSDVRCTLDQDELSWGEPSQRVRLAELSFVRLYSLPGWRYYGSKFSAACGGLA